MIKVIEDMGHALALMTKFFGITDLPVSSRTYKQAYRSACKKFHPDLGGNEEDFKYMQESYMLLNNSAHLFKIFLDVEHTADVTTTDGTPLRTLGLGLGPTKNGMPCSHCNGDGYTSTKGLSWKVCPHCDEFGLMPKIFMCKSCKGTGKFTQKRGTVVACRTCNGTGKFKHPRIKVVCLHCRGTKTIYGTNENEVFYHKCVSCNGTGEIEMWNPVLPKGLLKK